MTTQFLSWHLAAAATLATVLCLRAPSPVQVPDDESTPTGVAEAFAQAFNDKDIDGVLECYTDGAILMDPGPGMIFKGKKEIRKGFVDLFKWAPDANLRLTESNFNSDGDFAYGYTLWTITLKDDCGNPTQVNGRATKVMTKRDGRWAILSDHASVPMPAPPTAVPPSSPKTPAKK